MRPRISPFLGKLAGSRHDGEKEMAAGEVETSQRNLEDVKELAAETGKLAKKLRRHNERNHFAERIDEALFGEEAQMSTADALEAAKLLFTFTAFTLTLAFMVAYHLASRKSRPWWKSSTGRMLFTKAFGIWLISVSSVLARVDELTSLDLRSELSPFIILGYTVVTFAYWVWFRRLLAARSREKERSR